MTSHSRQTNNTPLLLEIIGLAGTGKSTITRALCQSHKEIALGERLLVWNVRHLPYIVKHTMLSLPILLRQPGSGRRFTRKESVKIVYLNGWHRMLMQQGPGEGNVTILDQGPIYDLATLHGFGPEKLHSQSYVAWWATMYEQWAQAIDVVIWLDAPIEILIERIRSREKWHPVKDRSVQDMYDYLTRYRSSHEYVMSQLAATRELDTLRFDTHRQTVDEIVLQVQDFIAVGAYSISCHHAATA